MKLHYKSFGQGKPLIILHGLFGSLDNWSTLGKKLAAHYQVFLVDQRNHGKSPHINYMNYELMAEDLATFIQDQGLTKSHILGHSMGGKTAMRVALDFPDLVDQLIVVDIAPKAYTGGHQAIFDALLGLPINKMTSRQEVEEQLSSHIDNPGVRQFLLKNLRRNPAGGFVWKMNLPVLFGAYTDLMAAGVHSTQFPGAVLFVRGDQSDYILDEDLPLMQKYFPAATLQTVPNAGHWVHAEAPTVLYEMIIGFLK